MIIGIGMDLAEVARYEFDQTKLAWFARKVYTEEEIAYAMRKRNRAERLAGFFAAKEATRKAFGHAIPWRLVGVSHARSGRPIIKLLGAAAALVERRSIAEIHLTITHTALMAAAVVVLEGKGPV
jgi:holo-[acyl-carrier protein] synthase